MKSRVEKYYEENNSNIQKRTTRNSNLYKEINNSELTNFNVTNNVKVIGENDSNYVNIDRLKEILDKNYKEASKRSKVKLAETQEEEIIEMEKTKEYDINAILEKAREEKEIDYEKERLKKIRDTQYDILKNLDIDEPKTGKIADSKTKEELLSLINTITENELQKTKLDLDPLDILSDLKGDENTVVMGAKEFTDSIKITENKISQKEETNEENKMDNSFYTNSLSFTQNDFDDFNDLKEDVASNKIILKILIVVIVIGIIIGLIFLLNKFLNLGLF